MEHLKSLGPLMKHGVQKGLLSPGVSLPQAQQSSKLRD